jgi:hypothetical protein
MPSRISRKRTDRAHLVGWAAVGAVGFLDLVGLFIHQLHASIIVGAQSGAEVLGLPVLIPMVQTSDHDHVWCTPEVAVALFVLMAPLRWRHLDPGAQHGQPGAAILRVSIFVTLMVPPSHHHAFGARVGEVRLAMLVKPLTLPSQCSWRSPVHWHYAEALEEQKHRHDAERQHCTCTLSSTRWHTCALRMSYGRNVRSRLGGVECGLAPTDRDWR